MKKIFLYLFLVSSLFTGCTENPIEPKPEKADNISGEYTLEGTQINQRICSPPYFGVYDCEPGEPLESDTVQTFFVVEIQFMENRKDTILFTGLEGADADITYHRDAADLPTPSMTECLTSGNPAYDCAYANLIDEKLTIKLQQFSAYYLGEGILKDGVLKLETIYDYRGTVVKYRLEGEKIE